MKADVADFPVRMTDTLTGHKPLRVGIIGYGLAGAVFHAPLVAATPGMAVAAIVTSTPNGRRGPGATTRPLPSIPGRRALADSSRLDLVVVATTNRAHAPLGIAALEAGLPVVIDKPFAPSSAEANSSATARRTGKLLTVFQNRRWDNDFLTAHAHRLRALGRWCASRAASSASSPR